MIGGVEQWYYSTNQADISADPNLGWSSAFGPVFFVQPSWPRYDDNEPIAFQGGLRVASQAPGSTRQQGGLLTFFSSQSLLFGFQYDPPQNGMVLGIGLTGAPQLQSLICSTSQSHGNCGTSQNVPVVCSVGQPPFSSLSCATIEGNGITQALWGNPATGMGLGCCSTAQTGTDPGQDPIIFFFPSAPYLATYANDNSCFKPLQTTCP